MHTTFWVEYGKIRLKGVIRCNYQKQPQPSGEKDNDSIERQIESVSEQQLEHGRLEIKKKGEITTGDIMRKLRQLKKGETTTIKDKKTRNHTDNLIKIQSLPRSAPAAIGTYSERYTTNDLEQHIFNAAIEAILQIFTTQTSNNN